jgi:hypothetical protein
MHVIMDFFASRLISSSKLDTNLVSLYHLQSYNVSVTRTKFY